MTHEHTHIWTTPNEHGVWTCATCQDTSPTCVVQRPSDEPGEGHPTGTSAGICPQCLRGEQYVLDDITDALRHYQRPRPSPVKAVRYDRDQLHRAARGTTVGKPLPEQLRDLADHLATWADMWAQTLGEQPPEWPLAWLKTRLLWAAQNPDPSAWDDYRTEIRTIRHDARRIAGLLPQRQAGPCVHCAGQVVRDWVDEHWQPRPDGLSDQLRCTGCDMTWRDRDHWGWVNGHTIGLLPTSHPDALVTLEHARAIWPDVPRKTWNKWRERDLERTATDQPRKDRGELGPSPERMPEQGKDDRGRPLYRLHDLEGLVLARYEDLAVRPGRLERISA